MKKVIQCHNLIFSCLLLWILVSCNGNNKTVNVEEVSMLDLKRGDVVLCGPPDQQLGSVLFETSCSEKVKKEFNLAMALLHSFEYDEAEKVFARVIDEEPECAMAYWGVAMSNYHPLWSPPTPAELEKGARVITIATSIKGKSTRESAYINAMAMLFNDWKTLSAGARNNKYKDAMENIYNNFPGDKEAHIFYALSLTAAADPADKTYSNQKKAYGILSDLYGSEPSHPGIVHYIIHSYDNPELASLALPAARKYASIAPSSAHAQHMPSHIFTRLGLWDECISSNLAATASAKCYAESAGIKGHWDEELHGLDYLMYAYLQKGNNDSARKTLDYLSSIDNVEPVNFKVTYAFAAIPSRYVLENKQWSQAATLESERSFIDWKKFPWQKAILHFTRLLGSAHTNNLTAAHTELKTLKVFYDSLMAQKDTYRANQVLIQMKTGEAWIRLAEKKIPEALELMNMAVELEDKTEKHPVTPGEVLPARELLADMYMQLNQPGKALEAYESNLKTHPNRFNSLYNAGLAAEKMNDMSKAKMYYQQLLNINANAAVQRPELEAAKKFLGHKNGSLTASAIVHL